MQEQGLSLRPQGGLLFLLLVLAFQERLAGNDPIGGHLFQPGHFAADHVEFLDGAEELRLHLQQVFVGQADLEQRLAGLNGLALDRINPRDHARHRRGDFQHGPTRTLDDHARHGHRPLEGPQFDLRQVQADVLLGLLAQLDRRGFVVLVVVVWLAGVVHVPPHRRHRRRVCRGRDRLVVVVVVPLSA